MNARVQIPEAVAGRLGLPRLPRRQRDEEFFVAAELIDAATDARRAQILLRLPDAVLLDKTDALNGACRQVGFKMGLLFIGVRISTLCANRLPNGELPDQHRATLDLWRNGLQALADGDRR